MFLRSPLSLLSLLVLAAQAQFTSSSQISFSGLPPEVPKNSTLSDVHLFTPFGSLDALSETTFTTLRHPLFPDYAVRIKKSKFCNENETSYTGYIDIGARHLFYYFFESRSDPGKDDVMLWTSGGPGCSSALALFMELGPCRINDTNGPTFNPDSWNSNANVFFIDQPIGVGFSYAEYGEAVSTTEEAAKDVAAFVQIFFEHFETFKGRPFHMAGESYGGRYIPLFAAEVYDQNARMIKEGKTPIVNLTSAMIGNGLTDFYTLLPSYYDVSCTAASVPPPLNIATCVRMKQAVPRCQKLMKAACVDQFDGMGCGAANDFCNKELSDPYLATGKNPYDMSKDCEGSDLCYPQPRYISEYLDKPDVRSLLGVRPNVTGNFTPCSDTVFEAFTRSQDVLRSSFEYVAEILERNVKVLIYVGTYDWICNWVGNERWTLAFEWSGHEDFVKQDLRDWKMDGKVAGKTRSAHGLTFATIDAAGHLVPYDKPKESLYLVQQWLANKDL